MLEQACYEGDVESHRRFAEAANGAAVIAWEAAKARWLEDAAQARAHKRPEPEKPIPAFKKIVMVGPYVPGPYDIITRTGPERVADGTLILPPIPSFGVENYPPNVTAIGNRTSDGGYWVALPNDTRPTGWIEIHMGRKLEKLEDRGNLGGNRRSFYFDRGAAE